LRWFAICVNTCYLSKEWLIKSFIKDQWYMNKHFCVSETRVLLSPSLFALLHFLCF
jgi:hypothetical protein